MLKKLQERRAKIIDVKATMATSSGGPEIVYVILYEAPSPIEI